MGEIGVIEKQGGILAIGQFRDTGIFVIPL
jgi:hypothetical protein